MATVSERLSLYHASCPECRSPRTVYLRSGDELVCQDCWPGREDATNQADSHPHDNCRVCGAEVSVVSATGEGWGVQCVNGHYYSIPCWEPLAGMRRSKTRNPYSHPHDNCKVCGAEVSVVSATSEGWGVQCLNGHYYSIPCLD